MKFNPKKNHTDKELLFRENSIDMKDKPCIECKKGKYVKSDLKSNIGGVLRCNNCSHAIGRWMSYFELTHDLI
jgi:hypothetical protein